MCFLLLLLHSNFKRLVRWSTPQGLAFALQNLLVGRRVYGAEKACLSGIRAQNTSLLPHSELFRRPNILRYSI